MTYTNNWVGYKLVLSKSAEKILSRLDKQEANAIRRKTQSIVDGALNLDILKLEGAYELPTYRLRCGDFRVIFEVHNKVVTIYVVEVGNRKDVYKK